MQHEHHRVPVTALACWRRQFVLAASGGSLLVYLAADQTLLQSIPVFEAQAIHGIVTPDPAGDGLVVVWGGQLLRALRLRTDQHRSRLSYETGQIARANDWILDATSCPQDAYRVAIVTAHNSLSIASAHPTSMTLELREAVLGSNCILYCAQVTWLSPSSCLIASGTAFGDIVVWSCHIPAQEIQLQAKHEIHYSFQAHDGSVFGVQVSPGGLTDAPGEPQRILASCSDDRSIRLWDISDLSRQSELNTADLRETGFGSGPSPSAIAPACLASAMGHISRIWHVRFVRAGSPTRLLSFGEDATYVTWSLIKSDGSTALQQVKVEKAHNGKNIWSVAIRRRSGSDPTGTQTESVFTGGADGSISIRDVSDCDQLLTWGAQQCAQKAVRYRSYGFVSPCDVVAVTDDGAVVSLKLDTARMTVQRSLLGPPADQLRGYSIIATIRGLAFFAGRGEVYYHLTGGSGYHVLVDVGEKVAGLFAQFNTTHPRTPCSLLVTTVKSRSAYWYQCTTDTRSSLKITSSRTLVLPEGLVVTSFAEFTKDNTTFIALGSRSGGIAIYSLQPQDHESNSLVHVGLFPGVHGIEAITALRYSMGMLLSTGRDGTFAVHEVDTSQFTTPSSADQSISLGTVHQLALPLGPNVEGFDIMPSQNIWVWGFRSKHFVVCDVTAQQEVMVVECGGAHRNFAFNPDTCGGTFLWTKTSELNFQHQGCRPGSSIHSGGHGREIKASATSPIDPQLVATGAEDTDIKLQLHENGTWRCFHTLQKHITGIQHLQWSSDGQHLFSSGGVEEFYVWKVRHDLPAVQIGVVCESAHPHCNLSDLRIMKFEAQARDAGYDITMVYSNSNLQKWHYNDRSWALLASGDYLTSCLTQCLRLERPSPPQQHQSCLFTASTDGHLVQWAIDDEDARCELTWHTRHKVHQSAVLSLISVNVSPGPGENHLLISGGDDNALGVTRVTFGSQSSTPSSMKTLLVPRAHAAAITALVVTRIDGQRLWLLTASIDQRIKLWKINIKYDGGAGVDGIDIALVKNVHSAVADISSMELVGRDRVLICGVGMDLWKLDLENLSGKD
ncbi:putative WD repeat-containing protein [Cercospora zeina]